MTYTPRKLHSWWCCLIYKLIRPRQKANVGVRVSIKSLKTEFLDVFILEEVVQMFSGAEAAPCCRMSLVLFPWSACRSVLGQDAEPQTAPDVWQHFTVFKHHLDLFYKIEIRLKYINFSLFFCKSLIQDDASSSLWQRLFLSDTDQLITTCLSLVPSYQPLSIAVSQSSVCILRRSIWRPITSQRSAKDVPI